MAGHDGREAGRFKFVMAGFVPAMRFTRDAGFSLRRLRQLSVERETKLVT